MKNFLISYAVCIVVTNCGAAADDVDFGRDIRPILSDKCFRCHGPDADNREADLRLDVRDVAVESGAILPGESHASKVIQRILSKDPDMVMPPLTTEKAISTDEAKLLQQWISDGADYAEHWAFVPPMRPGIPELQQRDWPRNSIDDFVLAELESRNMVPSAETDRVTLIRRLYLDLLGLPPSPEAVDAFLADDAQDAEQRLVQQLLDSRHFGERWGRWWLDAARYSDSDGYEKDKQRSVWFYRDWVIDAMNRDMPYDEFVIRQIAGDLLPNAGQSDLVATGFLRNSMVNEEGGADPEQFRIEGMFDRMDAIGKAILGITTQCAQCHTHKYDPLSHREYYQMFAALNDFHEATASVFTAAQEGQKRRILQEIAEIERSIQQQTPNWKDLLAKWADREARKLIAWKTVIPAERPYEGQKFRLLDDGSILSESYAPTKANNTFRMVANADKITAFRLDALMHPQLPRGGPGRSVFGTAALSSYEVSIAPATSPENQQQIRLVSAWADVNPDHSNLPDIFRDRNPADDDRVTGPIEYAIDGDNKTAWSTDIDPGRRNQNRHAVFLPESPIVGMGEAILSITLRQLHGGWNSDDNHNYLLGRYRFSVTDSEDVADSQLPSNIESILKTPPADRTPEQNEELFSAWRTTVPDFAEENAKIETLWRSFPETATQLVVQSKSSPRPTYVFKRGDFLSPGEQVTAAPPAFLNSWPESEEPNRLRFARWLVADDAPTTARVIVNRIWQSYFGRGIVATPEDFGYQSSPPTHPDLLDWLAVELMENQWSLKHIHRLIVDSATYRQSSHIQPWMLETDRFNELLARGPRHRVDAEVVRDIALVASGLLNRKVGGPSIYPPAPEFLFQPPASYGPKQWNVSITEEQYRRSLYVHGYRSAPFPALQMFDAPKGDSSCVRRQRSNTPLQALVVLNEPQFVECARAMAARVLQESAPSDNDRLQRAYRLCVSRSATPQELTILQRLLDQQRDRIHREEIVVDELIGKSTSDQQLTGVSPKELAPWIVVCRAILNLDETITKQ